MNLDRAADRVDDARKFHQHAVAGGLHDAPVVLGDAGIDQFATVGLQRRDGAHLVGSHKAAVADHIRRQNGRKPALHRFLR